MCSTVADKDGTLWKRSESNLCLARSTGKSRSEDWFLWALSHNSVPKKSACITKVHSAKQKVAELDHRKKCIN